ncbi:MAG: hypothetical protein SFU86_06475 [Pirellulaceae bacterium]|nr:hypothetical protein [Pirellulaceae bacterium]
MVAKEVNRIRSRLRHAAEQPAELVREYPVSSLLLVFGVGLGIGVLVGQACAGPLLSMAYHEPTTTERLSRQAYDALSSVLPASVAARFHS